jgi:hypothetical protein
MNSITKTGSQKMTALSMQRMRLGAALLATLVAASGAVAGTLPLGDFEGTKAGFYDVVESGPSIPPSLFTPKTPVYEEMPNPQLTFVPENFSQFVVETSGTTPFDLQYKTAQLTLPMLAKELVGNPDYRGYAFTGASLHLAGTYSVFAPFANSQAKVSMDGQYTIQITHVDWAPYTVVGSYDSPFDVTPSSVTSAGPQNQQVTGNWEGNLAIDWAAVKASAGLSAGQHVTGATIQFTTDIAAASIYGMARTTVTNFNVNAPVDLVAVPEPPTIILAGLGVAAAVGHGYRRRKLRQRDAEGSDAEWNAEEGAIALTA